MIDSNRQMKFRDELVAQIKDAGQELIDRAESMVGKDVNMISDFDIHVTLKINDYVPEITWTTSVISKNTIDRLSKKGD